MVVNIYVSSARQAERGASGSTPDRKSLPPPFPVPSVSVRIYIRTQNCKSFLLRNVHKSLETLLLFCRLCDLEVSLKLAEACEGCRVPGAGVTVVSSLPSVLGIRLWSLQEQPMLLTAQPSLLAYILLVNMKKKNCLSVCLFVFQDGFKLT